MPTYTGTSGADSIVGSSGSDVISGAGADDLLIGGDGSDTLYGGDGNDRLFNGNSVMDAYADHLYGQGGDDSLNMSVGDVVDGGAGHDTLYVFLMNASTAVNVNFASAWTGGTFSIGSASVTNVEALGCIYGTTGNDTLASASLAGTAPAMYGWIGADVLTGGAGDDWLSGYSDSSNPDTDADIIYGGDGNDRVAGGVGDYIDGGSGTDTLELDLAAGTSGVTLNFAPLLGGATGSIFGTTLVSIEHIGLVNGTAFNDTIDASADNWATKLYGGDGNDQLIGNAGNNILSGNAGNDTMTGGAGDDLYFVETTTDIVIETSGGGIDTVSSTIGWTLGANLENLTLRDAAAVNATGNASDNVINGNSAANTLAGLDGVDVLYGNGGDDILLGGTGPDTLYGGTGADTFRFNTSDFISLSLDTIADFSRAQADKIDVSLIDAVVGGSDNAFTFIGLSAFSGVAGQLRYDFVGGSTFVYGDTDGNGSADFVFTLAGNLALIATDFVL